MLGNIIERALDEFVYAKYTGRWPNQKLQMSLNLNTKDLYKNDTILLVVSQGQEAYGEFLDTCKELNVIYKSKKAVNMNYKDADPRNTLYVVEYV